jgi:hypothetical protein
MTDQEPSNDPASPPASGPAQGSASTPPEEVDVAGALKALAELRDQGAVTEEEFEAKKAEWLRKYGEPS